MTERLRYLASDGGTSSTGREQQPIADRRLAASQLQFEPLVRSADQRVPRPNLVLLGTVGGTAALQAALFLFPLTRGLLGITPLDRRDWMTILAGAVLPVVLAMQRRRLPEKVSPALPSPEVPMLTTSTPPVRARGRFRLA